MIYNSLNLECSRFTSPNRDETRGVFFRKRCTVATDSFRLLEVSTPSNIQPKDISPYAMLGCDSFLADTRHLKADVAAIKHLDDTHVEFVVSDGTRSFPRIDARFPDYEPLFPKEKPIAEVTINAKLLRELLHSLEKVEEKHNVRIDFYGSMKPLALFAENSTQKARALIMPVKL